jgi:hypothetical protein
MRACRPRRPHRLAELRRLLTNFLVEALREALGVLIASLNNI